MRGQREGRGWHGQQIKGQKFVQFFLINQPPLLYPRDGSWP